MEKFKKLSRAEMKNVKGGEMQKCGTACDSTGGPNTCPSSCNCHINTSGSNMGSGTCGATS